MRKKSPPSRSTSRAEGSAAKAAQGKAASEWLASPASSPRPGVASPSAADVERLHQQVYGRLKAVYDAHKAFAGFGDRELVVS